MRLFCAIIAFASVGPAAFASDHESPDSVIKALYDVISGPIEKKRDAYRFRALFHESAKMVSVGDAVDGKVRHQVITVEDYVTRSFPMLERIGFFETEVKRVTETYGNVVHVFSTYESRRGTKESQPFARGINSVQLMNEGGKWLVMSIVWQNESASTPIPAKYLPGG
ncbi:MAG: hypothetical protein WD716_05630 [Fimbriimonadaceae bacterium]